MLSESVLREYGYDARPDGDMGSDALYQMRSDAALRRQQELIEHNKEVRQRSFERRQMTATKKQIQRTVSQLDRLLNRGNKKANVKEGMRDAVSKALQVVEVSVTSLCRHFLYILFQQHTTGIKKRKCHAE